MFTFVKLAEEHLRKVLEWRTKPRVASRMVTSVSSDYAKHVAWFKGLTQPYWVVHHDGRPIGVINRASGDSWGYYIGEDDATPLGGLVLPYFYNHVFKTERILRADVMQDNDPVIKLHRFHGYVHRGKSDRWDNVIVMELDRKTWLSQSGRYGHMQAE